MKKSAYFKVIVTVTVLVAFLLMNILAKIHVELGSDKIVVKGIFTQTEDRFWEKDYSGRRRLSMMIFKK